MWWSATYQTGVMAEFLKSHEICHALAWQRQPASTIHLNKYKQIKLFFVKKAI